MVGHHHDFLGVEDLFHTDFAEFFDRDRRRDIIAQNHVSFDIDKLARDNFLFPAVCGQYFFS